MGGFGRLNKVAYWSMWAVALGRLDGVVVLDVVVNEDGFMQVDVPKRDNVQLFSAACVSIFEKGVGFGASMIDVSCVVSAEGRVDKVVPSDIELCCIVLDVGVSGTLC